ncbi:MAG TPA: cobalamin-binding protein [Nitrospirae bacterium]|nr:cobalamin-binding protein [Nitrospirota bacterium]
MKRLFIAAIFCMLFHGVAYALPPQRIISLAPSITEILYALGLENRIVAVTSFSDYPPRVREKAKIGGMVNPSLEAIVRLNPDIVILTTDGNPKEVEIRLRRLGIRTYVSSATRISELPDEIRKIGSLLGVKARAEKLAEHIEAAVSDSIIKAKYLLKDDSHNVIRKKAVFIVWPAPLIVAGPDTAIDDTLTMLGWDNIAADAGSRYPRYSIEELIRRSPDVIFIGKGSGMDELSSGLLKKLDMLDAVRKGRVYFTGDALYRIGPRVIDGIKEISGYLSKAESEQ